MAIIAPAEQTTTAFAALAAQAHRFAYGDLKNHRDLADFLRRRLGRPLVARLTGTADPNNVTRWVAGRATPERPRIHKMRVAAQVFYLLMHIFESEESAADWFTGENQALGFTMPADVINQGDTRRIFGAVQAVAQA